MRLATFRPGSGPARLGVVVGDRVAAAADLGADASPTMESLLAGGPDALSALRRLADPARIAQDGLPLDDVVLLAPVPRPGKVVAIGRNYADHTDEENGGRPPPEPLIFAKWPSSVVGPGAEIRWDAALTGQVDYEAELGVVIGRTTRNVAESDALDAVLGYTCVNDVSARDLQFGDGQWVRGKSLDTFCPTGPVVVTTDELPDPGDLAISCSVNGRVLQAARTSDMFYGVAAIVSHCSRSFTLEPGDLIATGTPGGVGVFRTPPIFLADGDEVVVSIEGIGDLLNICRATPAPIAV
jgi:2-keto-4-pentenoate hydratase/2-oxohepta-3-ene-1,7-dioic acid hydratase in catechol pathway